MSAPDARTRAGGRKGRAVRDKSAPPPERRAARPGFAGGNYSPLTPEEVERIHETALTILERIGMGGAPDALAEKAASKGVRLSSDGRLRFPRPFAEEILAGACGDFTLYGRDPELDIHVSGTNVHYGTAGAAVQTLDWNSGAYRASTLADVYDFARLADRMEFISWHSRNVVATDMPDNLLLDINTAYATAAGTRKNIATSFTIAEHVEPIIDMFADIVGGMEAYMDRPFCQAHVSPNISPLRYGADAVAVVQEVVKYNMPLHVVTAAQSGATSPAPLAGSLAQSHAEAMAGMIMINLFSPGHPAVSSNWPLVIDLRTGAFAGGGGECALMNAASCQLARRAGMKGGVAACMSDSKLPDAQAGYEKGITALATGLAGANLIYECASMFGSLMGVSYEGMAIDNEMLGHVLRTIRGIDVTDESLDVARIEAVVQGENHYLGEETTLRTMHSEYHYPVLGDRESINVWTENGALDVVARARRQAGDILTNHFPDTIARDTDARIRARLDIRLHEADMRPGRVFSHEATS